MRISDWSSDVCSSDLNGKPVISRVYFYTGHDRQVLFEGPQWRLQFDPLLLANPSLGKLLAGRLPTRYIRLFVRLSWIATCSLAHASLKTIWRTSLMSAEPRFVKIGRAHV